MTGPSRRAVLLGGAGAVVLAGGIATAKGWAPWSEQLQQTYGDPGRLSSGSFESGLRKTEVRYLICRPPGVSSTDHLPVVIALHGRGGSAGSILDVGLDAAQASAVAAGARGFAVVGVDGGEASYWHARRDGTDAGAMVTDELLPLLQARGMDTNRVALYGFSMGGWGALHLLATHPGRFRAAATASAALWTSAARTPAGAFDDAADFERTDVFAAAATIAKTPLRMDCGDADPFVEANRAFRALIPGVGGAITPGGHDGAYWRAQAPAELIFLAAHLR